MERIRISVFIPILQETHYYWVYQDQRLNELRLNVQMKTTYSHFLYHLQTHRMLEMNKSWLENGVFPGDTLLYI